MTSLSMEKGASNIHTSTKAHGGNNIDELRHKLFLANQGISISRSNIQSSKKEINDIITKNTKQSENLEEYSTWYKNALGCYNTNRGNSDYLKRESLFSRFGLNADYHKSSAYEFNHLSDLLQRLKDIKSRIKKEIEDFEEKETKNKDDLEDLEDLREKAEKIQEDIYNINEVLEFIKSFRARYEKIKKLENKIIENETSLTSYLATRDDLNDKINKLEQELAEEQSKIDISHASKIEKIREFLQEATPTQLESLENFSEINALYQSIQQLIDEFTSKKFPTLSLDDLIIKDTRISLENQLDAYINPIIDSIDTSNEERYSNEEKVERGIFIKETMEEIKKNLLIKYDNLQNLLKNSAQYAQDEALARKMAARDAMIEEYEKVWNANIKYYEDEAKKPGEWQPVVNY
jgi:DNA repair exonuclease SbcCD ATPase subunit